MTIQLSDTGFVVEDENTLVRNTVRTTRETMKMLSKIAGHDMIVEMAEAGFNFIMEENQQMITDALEIAEPGQMVVFVTTVDLTLSDVPLTLDFVGVVTVDYEDRVRKGKAQKIAVCTKQLHIMTERESKPYYTRLMGKSSTINLLQ